MGSFMVNQSINLIKDNLIDIKDDGSFRLDQDFLIIQLDLQ